MNRVVAYRLLTNELALYQLKPISELLNMVGTTDTRRVHDSGVDYDLSTMVQSVDDGVRVCVAIREATWGSPHDVLDEQIIRKSDAHL